MRAKALLFDFDGTLVDTAPDIADALNATLATLGHRAASEVQVRGWIGDGARALLGKALPVQEVEAAWPTFAAAYEEHCGRRSRVHEGVPAMLERCRAAGIQRALLTNKERRFTQRLLLHHGLDAAFELVVAGDTLVQKKPHPAVVQHALGHFGITPARAAHEALLIGDSVVDVRCARAAGVRVLLVRHGYPAGDFIGADAPDGFLESFDDLPGHGGE